MTYTLPRGPLALADFSENERPVRVDSIDAMEYEYVACDFRDAGIIYYLCFERCAMLII